MLILLFQQSVEILQIKKINGKIFEMQIIIKNEVISFAIYKWSEKFDNKFYTFFSNPIEINSSICYITCVKT